MNTYRIVAYNAKPGFYSQLEEVSQMLGVQIYSSMLPTKDHPVFEEYGKNIHVLSIDNISREKLLALKASLTGPQVYITSSDHKEYLDAIGNAENSYMVELPVKQHTLLSLLKSIINAEIQRSKRDECISHFKGILDNTNDVIYGHDLEGNIINFNAKSCEITGYTPEELAHMNVWQVLTDDCIDTARLMVQEKLEGKAYTTYELTMRDKHGNRIPVEVNSRILYRDGNPYEILGIARDITERKKAEAELRESEERFRTYTESTSILVMIYQNNRWIYANPSASRITGYPREELIGMNFWEIVHPDLLDIIKERGLARQRGEEPINEYEAKILTKNNEIRYIEFKADLINYSNQQAVLVSGVDITDRIKMEDDLRRSLQEKVVLLKEIHHRVKNNFQVITSLLNLQARNMKNEELVDHFSGIYNRIRSMALVHEKLYQSENISSLDFSGYVRSLVNEIQQSFSYQPGVQLEVTGSNVYLNLDQAVACGLIINELVSNSLKYACDRANAGGKVEVSLSSNGNGMRKITVRDNGPGIPDKAMQGTGSTLGMQLVHLLVEQLNGSIHIDNSSGTECIIHVPETVPTT